MSVAISAEVLDEGEDPRFLILEDRRDVGKRRHAYVERLEDGPPEEHAVPLHALWQIRQTGRRDVALGRHVSP